MTNNSAPETKRFQFSLRELFGMVLLTVFVTAFMNFVSLNRSSTDRTILLICTSVGTLVFSLISLWLFKTRQLLLMLAPLTFVALALASIIIPGMLRTSCGPKSTAAAAMCKAYAEAQHLYHRNDWDGDGVLEYAQTMQDLIDRKPGDGLVSMIDRTFANAEVGLPFPLPRNGYVAKVLTAHNLNGKQTSYIVVNNMTQGYACIVFPAKYKAGDLSYMIDNAGTIYENDLGKNTAYIVLRMTAFDVTPGSGWVRSE